MRDEALYDRLRTIDPPDRLIRRLRSVPRVAVQDVQMEQRAPAELTDTQLQALRCVSHGMTTDQAGDALGLTPGVIQQHLKAARYRMQAKTTAHACCLAIRQGLIA